MSDFSIDDLFKLKAEYTAKYGTERHPVGYVLREDRRGMIEREFKKMPQRDAPTSLTVPQFGGTPFYYDSEQTEECLAFFDDKLLRLYIKRNESVEALKEFALHFLAVSGYGQSSGEMKGPA